MAEFIPVTRETFEEYEESIPASWRFMVNDDRYPLNLVVFHTLLNDHGLRVFPVAIFPSESPGG